MTNSTERTRGLNVDENEVMGMDFIRAHFVLIVVGFIYSVL